jgi:phage N-6-adenine-methyltransferase
MPVSAVMFSSKTDQWATPQWLFDKYNAEYQFTLDACALPENAKVESYFSPEQDGLSQEWGGRIWMNPPYGREIGKWVKKAQEEAEKGAECVVCLLPSRTDTRWFHDFCLPFAKSITFLKGRLKFGEATNSAPFPSMVVVF